MLEIWFEHPVMLAVGGAALVALAGFFWMQTGHKAALYSTVALAAVTIVMLIVSLQVVTDRERIEKILADVAAAVQANDHEKCYSYIHPSAVEAMQRAKSELPRYVFSEARITNVRDIAVNSGTKPPTALAEFTVVVNLQFQGQRIKVPRLIKAYFMKHEDRWLVRDYEHFDILPGHDGPNLNSDFPR
ncbi:MAG: hypothetical protein R3C53_23705 [Pirellulaceae bacterium]